MATVGIELAQQVIDSWAKAAIALVALGFLGLQQGQRAGADPGRWAGRLLAVVADRLSENGRAPGRPAEERTMKGAGPNRAVAKRVRAYLGGEAIADSTGPCWFGRSPGLPDLLLPRGRRRPTSWSQRDHERSGHGVLRFFTVKNEKATPPTPPTPSRLAGRGAAATSTPSSGTPWIPGSRKTWRSSSHTPADPYTRIDAPPQLTARAGRWSTA